MLALAIRYIPGSTPDELGKAINNTKNINKVGLFYQVTICCAFDLF